MRTQIINFLLEQQNNDGSWGFSPGKAGAIEPTAYALMSLAPEERARGAIERGVAFLRKTQTVRGAWAVNTQDSEDFPEYLKIIDDEIFRCKGIISNLLDFSRNKDILKQEIRINETLEQTLQLLSHHKSFKQLQVVKELNPECPPVVGNNGELRQVFLAMCINAMDAMNESGTLTIRTAAETHNSQGFVRVQFQDTGVGIPPGNLNKIFDPLFTTKPVGKGTGLGLSICYGIVRSHEGSIKIESEVGKGSTFHILVPAKVK